MTYRYEEFREQIFTPEGTEKLLAVRDRTRICIDRSGAVRMDKAISGLIGHNWLLMACVDYLVERRELREIVQGQVWAQYRIFVDANE